MNMPVYISLWNRIWGTLIDGIKGGRGGKVIYLSINCNIVMKLLNLAVAQWSV